MLGWKHVRRGCVVLFGLLRIKLKLSQWCNLNVAVQYYPSGYFKDPSFFNYKYYITEVLLFTCHLNHLLIQGQECVHIILGFIVMLYINMKGTRIEYLHVSLPVSCDLCRPTCCWQELRMKQENAA